MQIVMLVTKYKNEKIMRFTLLIPVEGAERGNRKPLA